MLKLGPRAEFIHIESKFMEFVIVQVVKFFGRILLKVPRELVGVNSRKCDSVSMV